MLERQRLRKSPEELAMLRTASEKVIDSMMAVIAAHGPGSTKAEIAEALRREEVNRGLTFEYCLIAAGTSHNRAPSEQRWEKGDVLSVDSGGNYHGYIGDLARMAILGEPDAELRTCSARSRRSSAPRSSRSAPASWAARSTRRAEALLANRSQHNNMDFLAHGMGLVSHEAPHLTNHGPVPYTDEDAHRPLESRHGDLGRNHAEASAPRLHQAGGHGRGDRNRLRDLWRRRPRLEPRRQCTGAVRPFGLKAPPHGDQVFSTSPPASSQPLKPPRLRTFG